MNIDQIITKEEFDKIEKFDYDTLVRFVTRLVKFNVEESLKTLPLVMTHLSSQAAYLRELSTEFYKANKDLNTPDNKKIMSQTIEAMEGENPGKTYEEVLRLAAIKARDIISKVNQTPVAKDKPELKQFESHLGKL